MQQGGEKRADGVITGVIVVHRTFGLSKKYHMVYRTFGLYINYHFETALLGISRGVRKYHVETGPLGDSQHPAGVLY